MDVISYINTLSPLLAVVLAITTLSYRSMYKQEQDVWSRDVDRAFANGKRIGSKMQLDIDSPLMCNSQDEAFQLRREKSDLTIDLNQAIAEKVGLEYQLEVMHQLHLPPKRTTESTVQLSHSSEQDAFDYIDNVKANIFDPNLWVKSISVMPDGFGNYITTVSQELTIG